MRYFNSDGVSIAYIDVPPHEGQGDPILLIHGFASNHAVNWVNTLWVKTLTRAGYRVDRLRQSRPRAEREALRSRGLQFLPHGGGRRAGCSIISASSGPM